MENETPLEELDRWVRGMKAQRDMSPNLHGIFITVRMWQEDIFPKMNKEADKNWDEDSKGYDLLMDGMEVCGQLTGRLIARGESYIQTVKDGIDENGENFDIPPWMLDRHIKELEVIREDYLKRKEAQ